MRTQRQAKTSGHYLNQSHSLPNWLLGTNVNEIASNMVKLLQRLHIKVSSTKCQSFCLVIDVQLGNDVWYRVFVYGKLAM